MVGSRTPGQYEAEVTPPGFIRFDNLMDADVIVVGAGLIGAARQRLH